MRLLFTAFACLISVSVFGQNFSKSNIKEKVFTDINNDGTEDELSILSNSNKQIFLEIKLKDALRKTIRTHMFELIVNENNLLKIEDASLVFTNTNTKGKTDFRYEIHEIDNKIKIITYFENKNLYDDHGHKEVRAFYSFLTGKCVIDKNSIENNHHSIERKIGSCSKNLISFYDKIDLNFGLNLVCNEESNDVDSESLQKNISFKSSVSNFNINSIAVIPKEIKACDGSESSADELASYTETNILSHYNVTDRRHLEAILEEHRLQMSGLTLEKTLLESGCIENAQAYLFVREGCLKGDEIIELRLVNCETSTLIWSCIGINATPQEVLARINEELSKD